MLSWQRRFYSEISADDDNPPSSTGMAIYRDAYRGRLVSALETAFERTRRWVGEESFAAACAHYVLTCRPTSWTLDAYGATFPELLGELFGNNPEVGELAWLEWHLQQAFAARDDARLEPAALSALGLEAIAWDEVRFAMAPGFAVRVVNTACTGLWEALADGEGWDFDPAGEGMRWLVVWRNGLVPHYRLMKADEYAVLGALAEIRPLGEAIEGQDAEQAGAWLARWFEEGLFSQIVSC